MTESHSVIQMTPLNALPRVLQNRGFVDSVSFLQPQRSLASKCVLRRYVLD